MAGLVLNQKYKLHASDNFDEFMKALGELSITLFIYFVRHFQNTFIYITS